MLHVIHLDSQNVFDNVIKPSVMSQLGNLLIGIV
jgi:hypothetical protein